MTSNQTLSLRYVAASSSYASAPDSQSVSPDVCVGGEGKRGMERLAVMGWAGRRWSKSEPSSRERGEGKQRTASPGELRGGCRERAAQTRSGAPPSTPTSRHRKGWYNPASAVQGFQLRDHPEPSRAGLAEDLPMEP